MLYLIFCCSNFVFNWMVSMLFDYHIFKFVDRHKILRWNPHFVLRKSMHSARKTAFVPSRTVWIHNFGEINSAFTDTILLENMFRELFDFEIEYLDKQTWGTSFLKIDARMRVIQGWEACFESHTSTLWERTRDAIYASHPPNRGENEISNLKIAAWKNQVTFVRMQ